jgi:hypothetical protein
MHLINLKMKYAFLLTPLIALSSDTSDQRCEELQTGRYNGLFDERFRQHYGRIELTIEGNNALVKFNHLTDTYKIVSDGSCKYRFIDLSPDTSTRNEIQRELASLGTPYFQIDHRDKDTLHFIYRRNPHIMIYSGKFIYNKEIKRQK